MSFDPEYRDPVQEAEDAEARAAEQAAKARRIEAAAAIVDLVAKGLKESPDHYTALIISSADLQEITGQILTGDIRGELLQAGEDTRAAARFEAGIGRASSERADFIRQRLVDDAAA